MSCMEALEALVISGFCLWACYTIVCISHKHSKTKYKR